MNVTHGPEIIIPKHPFHQEHIAHYNGWLKQIWSFHGVDRGNLVEMDTEVWDYEVNRPLYLRSTHKETNGIYNSWIPYRPEKIFVEKLRIVFHCHTTDDKKIRAHWGLHLL